MRFRKRKNRTKESPFRLKQTVGSRARNVRSSNDRVRSTTISNLLKREKENDAKLAKWPVGSRQWASKMKKADAYRTELIRLGFKEEER